MSWCKDMMTVMMIISWLKHNIICMTLYMLLKNKFLINTQSINSHVEVIKPFFYTIGSNAMVIVFEL